jgi:membrane carboxypeptidase/penicillin-binding protein PbpC
LKISGKTVAVKTGTTNDIRDNWTIGYTPEYVVAVWVGNNDSTPMNPYLVSGVTGAAPIWNDVMSYILKDVEEVVQPAPSGIEKITVCAQTGSAPVAGTECSGKSEYFWKERLPSEAQVVRKNIWVYKDTDQPAFLYSTTDKEIQEVNTDLIELREHSVAFDPFVKEYCLDCALPTNEEGKVSYPQSNVDMSRFYWGDSFEPLDY